MYDKLADIYDYLVQSVDYDDWTRYIEEVIERFDVTGKVIVDLACGTGNTTIPLAAKGYTLYGVDLAPAMLDKAREKAKAQNLQVKFLQQDMRELAIPEQANIITCYHDGLNYILSLEDLKQVFARVKENLYPGGVFIFDLNRVDKLARHTGTDTTFIDEEDMSLIYESRYDLATDIWEIELTGFVRHGDFYEKFKETHKEKAHSSKEAMQCLEETGFELLAVYAAFSFEPPEPQTRRLFYIARRK